MSKKILVLGTAISTAWLMAAPAYAQDASGNVTQIQGISKSAGGQMTAQAKAPVKIPLKATYTQSVISKAVIEHAAPNTTAQELLAREPSIYVTNNGPGGVNQNITFRAFADGEFSETFDGIPLNDPFNAGTVSAADNDNNTLVTRNDFDQIDIYRGINNPATNSYNSLGGTINFDSIKPSDKAGGEVGGDYGSFDSTGWHATVNTGMIGGVKQIVSFARDTGKGWTQQDNNATSNLYYAFDAPLDNGATNIYGTFIYNQSAGQVNQLTPVDLLYKNGESYQYPTSFYDKQNNSTNFLYIIGVTQQVTPLLSVDVKSFAGENDYIRNSFSVGSFGVYALPDASHRPYHLYGYYNATMGIQPSGTLTLPFNTIQFGANLTFGHEHSREYFSRTSPVIPNPQLDGSGNDFWNEHMLRTEGSVFVQDTISLDNDRLKIIPGAKYLWAETKNHDDPAYYYAIPGNVSNYAHYLSPTISASYEILTGLDAYAAYGQNIKFPDITAYYNGDSQTNNLTGQIVNVPTSAQPEHVVDYEAGLRYVAGSLAIAGDYYRENFDNTFNTVTDPNTGLSKTTNGGRQFYQGVEAQIGDSIASPLSAVPGDFAGYINAAYNHAVYASSFNDPNAGSVTNGQPLGNVPQYLVSSGVSWTHEGYFVGVDTHYIGKQYINNAYTNIATSSSQGGYFLTNLTLADSVPVKLGAVNALKFSLNIDNLFSVHYYTQSDINTDNNGNPYLEAIIGAPRAVYGAVTAKF
ncbi:MAG: TonB-dependent receptor [Acidocella sp.]|nr:TonB-dependent receptor [Acidocella sp.]